jgi:dolichyl-phosphate beta-glucosyltransferase
VQLKRLSIVIPAYNEAARLSATLAAIEGYARGALTHAEILVVDDGSSDTTREIAEQYARDAKPPVSVRVLGHRPNAGKGRSVREGMLAATEPHVLMSDADLSTPIEDVQKLARALDYAHIAVGSRAVAGSVITRRQPLYRQSMGKMFNRFVQAVVLPGVSDTQCGFKLFRTDTAQAIFSRAKVDRFAFDVEVLYIARKLGLRVEEVPVRWHNSPASAVDPVRDSAQMLADLWRIRLLHRDL